MKRAIFPLLALTLLSAGCEQLGIEDPAKIAAAKEAEGKAVGSACRHASRAIEDCYLLNPKAQKAAVFAGWKEMDEYMRENKLEGVTPVVPRGPDGKALPPPEPGASQEADSKGSGKEGKDGKDSKDAKAKSR
ncbi:hypothetical protein [Pelomonas sp. SE-A7]|uniref:hypothetical protein n=1 Tax=Pelomonas sp. SE-A7 TaxID=3054953 RepID=UPI00259CC620|nr:hypothetical protein [Pelomonas sp. SE-A7]MDM4766740.1 hypothetical protein [Pelomonas sp. SE-A7]